MSLSWGYDPSGWTDGVTVPHVADYQNIAADLHKRGGNVDGGGFGRANTAFLTLIPGALPGTTYTVTGAAWAAGVATLTIGAHTIGVNQVVTVSGAAPSGWNAGPVAVTAVTGTTIKFALAANPGAWTSGGTVLVGSVPGYGTLAVNPTNQLEIFLGSSWAAATTAVAAGVWWTGSGAPSNSLGSNGDMYLDSAAWNVYGPKAAGAWPGSSGSIKGATGTAGTNASAANWRGAYASGTTYAQGDGVTYSGSAYVSLQAGNTGNTPSTSPTYWVNIGSSGLADPGSNGMLKRTALNVTAVAGPGDLQGVAAAYSSRGYTNTAQAAAMGVALPVNFELSDYDNGGIHSTSVNPSRFTAPVSGYYLFDAQVAFGASAAGIYELVLVVNVSTNKCFRTVYWATASGGGYAVVAITSPIFLNSGDYVQVQAYQNVSSSVGLVVVDGWTYCSVVKLP